jgi:hypothetical protein
VREREMRERGREGERERGVSILSLPIDTHTQKTEENKQT